MFSELPGELAKVLDKIWPSLQADSEELSQEDKIAILRQCYAVILSEDPSYLKTEFDKEVLNALDGILNAKKRKENTSATAAQLPRGFIELTNIRGCIIAVPAKSISFIEEGGNKLRLTVNDKLLEVLESRKELYEKMKVSGNQ